MRLILVASLLAAASRAQTLQEASAARQREAVQKQRDTVRSQSDSVARQIESAARQPKLAPWMNPPLPPAQPAEECAALAPAELDPLIGKAARDSALTPDLLRAVIARESAGQPCAVSRSGAMGLMQLMPGTAFDLGVGDPFDPEQNISAGSRFLRLLLDRYDGDLSLALGAYNAGPARVDAVRGIPPIPETRDYVKEILRGMR